ncbi:hypothetical protein LOTGIDRAFT_152844 [Lottia gigantea]|uniref:Thioredoxin-like fold domain-containing protein n=1 Tax=Lottia gigantea TaxID=225164 RepID=V4AV95_LOTGI|nr:hypothetical protein LOTGIDRAFT_152844 [Lottia gigantea]ESO97751.1 hypothetical protein LOTGIDRAFT_152844 [Lottia gigantea]
MAFVKPVVFVCLFLFTSAQIPIPRREVGYAYNSGLDNASVHLDVYMDLVCPDSKQAFPTLLQLADHYGATKLQLKMHIFPLPYHRNSWIASKGAHIIAALTKGNETFEWMDTLYNNYDLLTNDATQEYSQTKMISFFAKLVVKLGIDPKTFVTQVLHDRSKEDDTRIAWKYACTRGVAATPTFMVNDITVAATPSWTVQNWTQLIDPFLSTETKQ